MNGISVNSSSVLDDRLASAVKEGEYIRRHSPQPSPIVSTLSPVTAKIIIKPPSAGTKKPLSAYSTAYGDDFDEDDDGEKSLDKSTDCTDDKSIEKKDSNDLPLSLDLPSIVKVHSSKDSSSHGEHVNDADADEQKPEAIKVDDSLTGDRVSLSSMEQAEDDNDSLNGSAEPFKSSSKDKWDVVRPASSGDRYEDDFNDHDEDFKSTRDAVTVDAVSSEVDRSSSEVKEDSLLENEREISEMKKSDRSSKDSSILVENKSIEALNDSDSNKNIVEVSEGTNIEMAASKHDNFEENINASGSTSNESPAESFTLPVKSADGTKRRPQSNASDRYGEDFEDFEEVDGTTA
jgi:hypothetical protein